jgi:hypothetical protein
VHIIGVPLQLPCLTDGRAACGSSRRPSELFLTGAKEKQPLESTRFAPASAEWELAEGRSDRAVRIYSAAMPRAVVHTVEQCKVPGLITDMRELAEATDGDLAGKLRPLTEAYAAWIAELEAWRAAEGDLLDYADASAQVVGRARGVLGRLEEGIALLAANADVRDAFRFANRAMRQPAMSRRSM